MVATWRSSSPCKVGGWATILKTLEPKWKRSGEEEEEEDKDRDKGKDQEGTEVQQEEHEGKDKEEAGDGWRGTGGIGERKEQR